MSSSKRIKEQRQEDVSVGEQSLADFLFVLGKSRGRDDSNGLLELLEGIEDKEKNELLKVFEQPKSRVETQSFNLLVKYNFDEVDLAIISHLWCTHIEGSRRSDVLHLLNRISSNPVVAYQRLDKIRQLLHQGYIVEDCMGSLYNPFLAELHAKNEHELISMDVSLSPLMLQFITGKAQRINDYDSIPFTDDEDHIQTWLCLLSAGREYYNSSVGTAVFKQKWIMEAQPFIRSMLNSIYNKEACTTTPLRLRDFCTRYKLTEAETMLFVMLVNQDINGEEDMFTRIFRENYEDYISMHKSTLDNLKKSRLVKQNLIQFPGGSVDKCDWNNAGSIVISPWVKEDLFGSKEKIRIQTIRTDEDILKECTDLGVLFDIQNPVRKLRDIILPAEQIDALNRIISLKQDSTVVKLSRWGMDGYTIHKRRRGYLLLLCGSPGTGKTLAAEVIAAEMGKAIMKTDSAHILDKYYGESEKNAAVLFERFNRFCNTMQNPPVLLFNEADQLLSRRSKVESSSDKAWNATASIFLEAFENPRGIIIATTNLLDNIDEAYSRRFDLILKLTPPGEAERQRIWDVRLPFKIPGRQNLDVVLLAKYPLSGGQIMKVIRNAGIYLASGNTKHRRLSTELVSGFCRQELISSFDKAGTVKTIGFATQREVI